MFSKETLEEFYKQKLWYNICVYIQEYSNTNLNDCLDCYKSYVLPNETRIYYKNYCDTTLILANLLQPNESQQVVLMAINEMHKNEFINDDKERSLLKLLIKIHENKIYLNEIDEIEKFIYEIKNKIMDKETKNNYFKLCYKYYESKKDFDEAYENLKKYLECKNENTEEVNENKSFTFYDEEIKNKKYPNNYEDTKELLATKLVKFSLLSTKVYNFTEIFCNKIYKYLNDENLKIIFEKIMSGDFEFVLNNKNMFESLFPNNFELLKEKVYLVGFINLCFYRNDKYIGINEIKNYLKLEREFVFFIIMKALGLELIKGIIDGENDVLKLTYVIPRILNREEIDELKRKCEIWKMKIGNVINLFK